MNPRPIFLVALALTLVLAQQAAHAAPSPELVRLQAEYKQLQRQHRAQQDEARAQRDAARIKRLREKIARLRLAHPDPARAARGEVVSDPEGVK